MSLPKRWLIGLLGIFVPAAVAVLVVGGLLAARASDSTLILEWEPGRWSFGHDDTQIAAVWVTRVGNLQIEKKPVDAGLVLGPLKVGARRWVQHRIVRTGRLN